MRELHKQSKTGKREVKSGGGGGGASADAKDNKDKIRIPRLPGIHDARLQARQIPSLYPSRVPSALFTFLPHSLSRCNLLSPRHPPPPAHRFPLATHIRTWPPGALSSRGVTFNPPGSWERPDVGD
ncbi:hypothetical protein E2C01_054315 [Portunus trituberculatus]|uniref:Uncharacterized protein n=1 Tax=Portunus trituberculatus TaxID=210409 RepID=A0A5B7GRM7_PORTR|nr:hypothetical protein [Portunus trituberculatus]